MKYMLLERREQSALLEDLSSMPEFLVERFGRFSPEGAAAPPADGSFSAVEHCWHLADLEVEGFGARIRQLLEVDEPVLPDFDGASAAVERRYLARSLLDGISVFGTERAANLRVLRSLTPAQWNRRGTQEGVGVVSLCDLPVMMAEHDAAHRAEIEAWTSSA